MHFNWSKFLWVYKNASLKEWSTFLRFYDQKVELREKLHKLIWFDNWYWWLDDFGFHFLALDGIKCDSMKQISCFDLIFVFPFVSFRVLALHIACLIQWGKKKGNESILLSFHEFLSDGAHIYRVSRWHMEVLLGTQKFRI